MNSSKAKSIIQQTAEVAPAFKFAAELLEEFEKAEAGLKSLAVDRDMLIKQVKELEANRVDLAAKKAEVKTEFNKYVEYIEGQKAGLQDSLLPLKEEKAKLEKELADAERDGRVKLAELNLQIHAAEQKLKDAQDAILKLKKGL